MLFYFIAIVLLPRKFLNCGKGVKIVPIFSSRWLPGNPSDFARIFRACSVIFPFLFYSLTYAWRRILSEWALLFLLRWLIIVAAWVSDFSEGEEDEGKGETSFPFCPLPPPLRQSWYSAYYSSHYTIRYSSHFTKHFFQIIQITLQVDRKSVV